MLSEIKKLAVDTFEFIRDPEQLSHYFGKFISVILIFVIARISIKLLHSIVNSFFQTKIFTKSGSSKFAVDIPRMETLKGLIKSISKYIIYFIAFATILDSIGFEIGTLIAAAGIGGLAIGFGAQNLVKDIITGFFILFEDQFSVGHYVEIDSASGIVEEMALRVTKLRDFNGDLHIIPNGQINKVTNRSVGNMRALVEISIAYEEDINKALEVLNKESEKIRQENPQIVEGPIVLGVSSLAASEVVITIIAKTIPMEQWAVERLMRKTFKEAFDREDIEIPYPRTVLIDKNL
ncbi:mechanosensitive ion channel family protein [Alkaliphilus serpentinus]|uniref:Mechanosensitive ion channel family protein n=1 Tax=Alkaliphilus serpentinus TaxID=1482731 RepID=A0A833MET9_9FIRM|nr:mechanosensitive ion channel family protein [Alkaliphilus serpentinus]